MPGIYVFYLILFVQFIIAVLITIRAVSHTDTKIREGAGVILLVWFMIVMLLCIETYDQRYKEGQIDAINGTIKYKLVTNPDSSKIWRKIIKYELVTKPDSSKVWKKTK